MNRDPIGYSSGSMNLYSYVGGMPTYYEDPHGLAQWWNDSGWDWLNPFAYSALVGDWLGDTASAVYYIDTDFTANQQLGTQAILNGRDPRPHQTVGSFASTTMTNLAEGSINFTEKTEKTGTANQWSLHSNFATASLETPYSK